MEEMNLGKESGSSSSSSASDPFALEESTSHSPLLKFKRRLLLFLPVLLCSCYLYVTYKSSQSLTPCWKRSVHLESSAGSSRAIASSTSPIPVRLLVVSVTGTSKLDIARRIQDYWQPFLGPHDVVRTICDIGCSNHASASGRSGPSQDDVVVELDPDLVKSIQRPRHFEASGNNPWGYRLSQIKFYFGLISQVQQFVEDPNHEVPHWILIKDDDGYVHADRLMQLVEDVDFTKEKVSLVGGFAGRQVELLYPPGDHHVWGPPKGCHWPSGGSGWLLSQAMALELALNQSDRVYEFMRHKLEQSEYFFHYDVWLPVIASFGGGRLYHSPAFRHLTAGEKDDCFDPSTNSTSLVSIHMKDLVATHGMQGALERLESCMRRPFAPTEFLRDRIVETKRQNGTVQYCTPNKE